MPDCGVEELGSGETQSHCASGLQSRGETRGRRDRSPYNSPDHTEGWSFGAGLGEEAGE